jgi:hypothetical protein
MSDTCKSCGARVRWVQLLPRGTAAPLDPTPTSGGNIRLSKGGAVGKVLPKAELAAARRIGEHLHTSHFATCPGAEQHRRKD